MGRRHADAFPVQRLHKQSGQARVRIDGREFRLGPYGSPEATLRFDKLVGEWLANGRKLPGPAPATSTPAAEPAEDPPCPPPPSTLNSAPAADLTIGDLCLRWIKSIQNDRADWKQCSKYHDALAVARALRPVATMAARDFGPRQLIEVRAALARTPIVRTFRNGKQGKPKPRTRANVNDVVGSIVQMFRWAVPLELVPPDKAAGLREVPRLKPGEMTILRETEPRKPVPDDIFEATLPHLRPPVRALVQFLRWTGCRPSEGAILRMADVTKLPSGVWEYVPSKHKNQWRGQGRHIYIGPRLQRIVVEALGRRGPDAYVFDPRLAIPERRRRPDTIPIENPKPSPRVRDRYTKDSLLRAVTRACEEAGVVPWSPYQLRHTRAREVRHAYGDHAAQGTLGDRSRAMIDHYAPVAGDAAAAAALATG